MNPELKSAIDATISQCTGRLFRSNSMRDVSGGCINQSCIVGDGLQRFFVKHNRADLHDMFAAEGEGLREIRASEAIRVPEPIGSGTAGRSAYLVLEHVALSEGQVDDELFGRQLAQMHRRTQTRHGWHRDNTIGSTPQINTHQDDWLVFWREQRLGYQLSLAAQRGHHGALQHKGEQLMARLDRFFPGYAPAPALLHGDLWSGNYGALADGCPVIYDPAVYYGDRETDLAMTELFGGFSRTFYDAYREAYPLDPGYNTRKTLYNLYHVLNHLNLFGGGYGAQAENMLDRLLSELKG